MHRQWIRSMPKLYGKQQCDTVLVELGEDGTIMKGMVVAHVKLFYSIKYCDKEYACALVNWLLPEEFDEDMGRWIVPGRRKHGCTC